MIWLGAGVLLLCLYAFLQWRLDSELRDSERIAKVLLRDGGFYEKDLYGDFDRRGPDFVRLREMENK